MAKLKMVSVELAAPVSRRDEILDYLQRKGALELSQPEETGNWHSGGREEDIAELQQKMNAVNTAGDILAKFCPVKKPLTAMLEPRMDISPAEYALKSKEVQDTYEACEKIIALQKSISSLKADIIRYETQIEQLRPWESLDIPMSAVSTKHITVLLGSFRGDVSTEYLLSSFAREIPENDRIEVERISGDDNESVFAVFCCRDEAAEVETVLRSLGYISAPDCPGGNPVKEIKRLTDEKEKAQLEIENNSRLIKEQANLREKIEFAKDHISILRDKYFACSKIIESERVFYIKGYMTEKDGKKTASFLEKNCDAAVSISVPGEDEDVPVVLSNNFFAAPLEGITGMYSLPGKYDPDPTGIMAFFYYFFFGMMLSDAGYGLLMVLATGSVLLFKRNMENKMKNMCRMYLFCGLSTMFWGAMYGSWFGDMINVIRTEFLGLPETRLYIWMEPVNSLMELMVYCFLFGLVHLFVGVGVKAVTNWKNGDKLGAFCDSVPTYLTILGIAPIFFGLFTEVPPMLSTIGTPVLIAGLVLVILTAGRSSKSIVGKLGGGLYEVYNLVGGYLGDVLSYARLLALGLSTGVIAEVMNMLGVLPSNKILKLIMFIVVAIVGHIANFAINIIGAYVHTNRLQYVEFFGKFYEGGGRAFVPLETKTQYYKFKEENQL